MVLIDKLTHPSAHTHLNSYISFTYLGARFLVLLETLRSARLTVLFGCEFDCKPHNNEWTWQYSKNALQSKNSKTNITISRLAYAFGCNPKIDFVETLNKVKGLSETSCS